MTEERRAKLGGVSQSLVEAQGLLIDGCREEQKYLASLPEDMRDDERYWRAEDIIDGLMTAIGCLEEAEDCIRGVCE